MAEFKKDDKVRIIASADDLEAIWAPRSATGVEGVVIAHTADGCMVQTAEPLDDEYSWAYKSTMLEKIDG